jgi:hypothetical protein
MLKMSTGLTSPFPFGKAINLDADRRLDIESGRSLLAITELVMNKKSLQNRIGEQLMMHAYTST